MLDGKAEVVRQRGEGRKRCVVREEGGRRWGGGLRAETRSKVTWDLADNFRAKDEKLCRCSTGWQRLSPKWGSEEHISGSIN